VDLDRLTKEELKERHLDLLERFHALEEQMMVLNRPGFAGGPTS
jgi:hypothetical protein